MSGILPLEFKADYFRTLYACLTIFLWLLSTGFSKEYIRNSNKKIRYYFFNSLTMIMAIGFFYSDNFLTAFLFFELMSLSSYIMVIHNENPNAMRAGESYLSYTIIGGLAILMGIFILNNALGTLSYNAVYEAAINLENKSILYTGCILIFIGYGAKAGLLPLHTWLVDTYSSAPAPAGALLSGILSKTGIFGIMAINLYILPGDYFWTMFLLIIAASSMLFGAVMGILQDNLLKTIAYSSISQMGFIMAGTAIFSLSALDSSIIFHGTVFYMFNHSIFKVILFLLAGTLLIINNDLHFEKIKGYGRGKKILMFSFLMASLGISSIPLFSGFIGKTLIYKGIWDSISIFRSLQWETVIRIFNWVFMAASGLTIGYMTKIFTVLFIDRGETGMEKTNKSPYIKPISAITLLLPSILVPVLGLFPGLIFPESGINYFTRENIFSMVIPVIIGASVFLLDRFIIGRRLKNGMISYINVFPMYLNLENLVYRPVFKYFCSFTSQILKFFASLPDLMIDFLLKTLLCTNKKPYEPGKFLSGHYRLFFKDQGKQETETTIIGNFSLNLLLAAAGIGLALVFVFIMAVK